MANIHRIMEKARELQKNFYFCFINYAKAFVCVDHNELWKTDHPRQHIKKQRHYFANKVLSGQGYGFSNGFSSGHGWM